MDVKNISGKAIKLISKYKYAAIVLAIGVVLLLLPSRSVEKTENAQEIKLTSTNSQTISASALTEILQSIQGAGKVQVLLSVSSGERIIYQTDSDQNTSGDTVSTRVKTIIITDSQRNESGLISRVDPPSYMGAIVVCEGADSASVRLDIIQAVSKITGLGADNICVLKMK